MHAANTTAASVLLPETNQQTRTEKPEMSWEGRGRETSSGRGTEQKDKEEQTIGREP